MCLSQFCPESNDLLYPVEDRERRRLVFKCQSCNYQEDAPPSEWCVYRCVFGCNSPSCPRCLVGAPRAPHACVCVVPAHTQSFAELHPLTCYLQINHADMCLLSNSIHAAQVFEEVKT